MGDYEQLKQAVADVIKTNGNQEITGEIMQNTLLSIISTVGSNATFAGIAVPETNPGTPQQNVFYLASQPGVYVNFGALELTDEVCIFTNKKGSWEKYNAGIPTSAKNFGAMFKTKTVNLNIGSNAYAKLIQHNFKEGDSLLVKLICDGNAYFYIQGQSSDESYPVLSKTYLSNKEYTFTLSKEVFFIGFSTPSTNQFSGNAVLYITVLNNSLQQKIQDNTNVIEHKIIKLTSLGSNPPTIQDGDYYYRNNKLIKVLVSSINSLFEETPPLDALYLYNNEIYIYNGEDMVKSTKYVYDQLSEQITLLNKKVAPSLIKRDGFIIIDYEDLDYIDSYFQYIKISPLYKKGEFKDILFTLKKVSDTGINFDIEYRNKYGVKYKSNEWISFRYLNVVKGILYIEISESVKEITLHKKFSFSPILNIGEDYLDNYEELYPYSNIIIDGWVPTVGSGLQTLKIGETLLVDNKYNFDVDKKYSSPYKPLYWLDAQIDRHVVNEDKIIEIINSLIEPKLKAGLMVFPSCRPETTGNYDSVNDAYYFYPTWVQDLLMAQQDGEGVYKPYLIDLVDLRTGAPIKVYMLDWRDNLTLELYKELCDEVSEFLKTKILDNGKPLYNYIDYIKVGTIGVWGEGTDIKNVPLADRLIELSDYLTEKFPEKIKIQPIASILGNFPEDYKKYLINGNWGIFKDSTGEYIDNYKIGKIIPNELYLKYQTYPIYLECYEFLPPKNYSPLEPSFRKLVSEICCYRGNYLSVSNLFYQTNAENDINVIDMVRNVSKYIGTKLAVYKNYTKKINTNLHIHLTFGNIGTGKIYNDYWKVKFYITDGVNSKVFQSMFDLKEIPIAIMPNSPNWRNTKAIIEDIDVTEYGSIRAFMTIEDIDEIYENMYLSNTSNFLNRIDLETVNPSWHGYGYEIYNVVE